MAYIQDVQESVPALPEAGNLTSFVVLSQNENGRQLLFKIVGIDIPSGSTATFSGTKPDGVVYSTTGTISGNVVTVNEDIQMTAVAGSWDAKIRVLNGGNVIASAKVRITIDADPVAPGSIPSDSQLDGIVAECQAYAESARSDAYGSPLTASTAAGMIDKTRVYVYTGSETGYTNGHWYYWDGTAWADGGTYNSSGIQTDTTLSVPGMAADAKAAGDEVADLKEDFNNGYYSATIINGIYIDKDNGTEIAYPSWSATDYIPIPPNYKMELYSAYNLPYSVLYDSNKTYEKQLSVVNGTTEYINTGNTVMYFRASGATASVKSINIKVYEFMELYKRSTVAALHSVSSLFVGYYAKVGGAVSAYPTRVVLDKFMLTEDCTIIFDNLADNTTFGNSYDAWFDVYDTDGTTIINSANWAPYTNLPAVDILAGQWFDFGAKYSPVEVDTSSASAINNIGNAVRICPHVKKIATDDNIVSVNRDLQNNNTILFAWASDTHHQARPNTQSAQYGEPLYKLEDMAKVAEAVKVDFLTVTGDVVNGYYPVDEQKMNLIDTINTLRENCNVPILIAEGNHDDNSWYASANGSSGTTPTGMAQVLTNDQFTNYAMNNSIESVVFNESDPLGGYYYKDFRKAKIRVIMLNVEDIPYIENADHTLKYYGQWTFAYQESQLDWLANKALKFNESGWGVVFLQHNDKNMTENTSSFYNYHMLNAIVAGFMANSSGTTTSTTEDFEASVSYDFTNNPSNEVIAWFSGHIHSDTSEIIDGVPHVTIINMFNANGGGFDIVTVDRVARKIYTKRYNDGEMPAYDREINY